MQRQTDNCVILSSARWFDGIRPPQVIVLQHVLSGENLDLEALKQDISSGSDPPGLSTLHHPHGFFQTYKRGESKGEPWPSGPDYGSKRVHSQLKPP